MRKTGKGTNLKYEGRKSWGKKRPAGRGSGVLDVLSRME